MLVGVDVYARNVNYENSVVSLCAVQVTNALIFKGM